MSSVAEEYRQALEELTCNNKTQINLLTILADENSQHAHDIVNVIENHVLKVPKDQKLPVMYVADSILKNVKQGTYKEEFRRNIITVFLHVFKEGDEKVRVALYKLRQTWVDTFPRSKLYELDMKVQQEDRAWPIANPGGVEGAQAVSSQPSRVGSGNVHVNPKFISGQSKQQQQPQSSASRPPPRNVIADGGKRLKVEVGNKEISPPKQRHHFTNNGNRDVVNSVPVSIKSEPLDVESIQKPINPKRKMYDGNDSTPYKRKSQGHTQPSQQQDIKPVVNIRTEPTIAPGAHAFVKPPPPLAKPSPPLQSTANTHTLPGTTHAVAQHSTSYAPFISHGKAPLLPPPPAFSQPPSFPPPNIPHGSAYPVLSSSGPSAFPPRGGLLSSPNPSTVFPHNNQPMTMSPILPPSAPVLPPPIPSSSSAPTSSNSPIPTPKLPAVITHDQVKLEGIPANNRIFVDGKAHEVFYIDDTAVIERNGLPHRIYFAGTHRNVVIDGAAHSLEFGKSKTVLIDGEEHVIRFGAPSRELYMGDFPFKGAFGGPPIFATINNKRHEIQLVGPAPEVKIDPTPSFDLARFMKQIRQPSSKPKTVNTQDSNDMTALLTKLVSSGLINTLKSKAAKENQPPAFVPTKTTVATTSSAPAPTRIGKVERMAAPATTLTDFNLNILKIRYDSVINALHEKRRQCPHCGLRLEQLKGDRHQRHMDWHVKKNLKLLDNASHSRQWYLTSTDWIRSSDIDDDEDQKKNEEESKEEVTVAIKDTESRTCASCNEPFVRVFDEDEDTWQMKDCVMHNGKTYHSGCMMDASLLVEKSETKEDLKVLSNFVNEQKMNTNSMEQ